MLTHELAKRAGVNTETLRFYERKGLLNAPKRTASGYRMYYEEALRTVRFIKRAQGLGFTLAEVNGLLRLSAHEQQTCGVVQVLGSQKVNEVDAKIRDLQAIKAALGQLLETCHEAKHEQRTCPFLTALE